MNELQTHLADQTLTWTYIARTIDHAILHPTTTDKVVRAELESLKDIPLASVCIKPTHVPVACEILRGGAVAAVCTVIGFPHGTQTPEVKAYEAERAFADGATEMDMVVNTGKVLSGDWDFMRNDIGLTLAAVRRNSGVLKVIFETDFLTADSDKIALCMLCSELGVDFVKTSTGFGFVKQATGGYNYVGATEHDLMLMRAHCASGVGVKASGGVRNLDAVLTAIRCGATRIGASATMHIVNEAKERFGGLSDGTSSHLTGDGY